MVRAHDLVRGLLIVAVLVAWPPRAHADEYTAAAIALFPKGEPDARINRTEPNGPTLSISYQFGTGYLTDGHMRRAFNQDVLRAFPSLFSRFPKINRVRLIAFSDFREITGHTVNAVAFVMVMTRQTNQRIKWSAVDPANLPRLADHYHLHPALKK